jgi:hypothetical protein
MRFLLELFRSRPQDLRLLEPARNEEQRQSIAAGVLPTQ